MPAHCVKHLLFVCIITALCAACEGKTGERITDRAGNSVTLGAKKERVISTTPSSTEIIVALGQAHRLAALDKYSKDIEGVDQSLPELDLFYPDAEAILACSPDIIIANALNRVGAGDDPFALLKGAGVAVAYVPMSDSIEGICEDIRFIARLLDVPERGEEVIAEMQSEIAAVNAVTQTIPVKKRVYFEISPPPQMVTLGGGSYLNEALTIAGGDNIFGAEKGILFPSAEEIMTRNPDVMLTNINYTDDPVGELRTRQGFEHTNAVKNNAVFAIDTNSSSRPSQRIIYAIKEIARVLYPEYYTDDAR